MVWSYIILHPSLGHVPWIKSPWVEDTGSYRQNCGGKSRLRESIPLVTHWYYSTNPNFEPVVFGIRQTRMGRSGITLSRYLTLVV